MTLGEQIRKYRERQGWSANQVADMVGVPTSTITRWERDITLPTMQTLLAFCEATGASVLVSETGPWLQVPVEAVDG